LCGKTASGPPAPSASNVVKSCGEREFAQFDVKREGHRGPYVRRSPSWAIVANRYVTDGRSASPFPVVRDRDASGITTTTDRFLCW
jgi:hypothetical protein